MQGLQAQPFSNAYRACFLKSVALASSTEALVAPSSLQEGRSMLTNCLWVFVVEEAWDTATAAMSLLFFLALVGAGYMIVSVLREAWCTRMFSGEPFVQDLSAMLVQGLCGWLLHDLILACTWFFWDLSCSCSPSYFGHWWGAALQG